MSQAGSQAWAFYREVARTQVLWTIRDDGGFPAPKAADGARAQPFWSSRSRVTRIINTVPAYSGFHPHEVAWQEFCDRWVPGLTEDDIKIGVNWSGARAHGYDIDAGRLEQAVETLIAEWEGREQSDETVADDRVRTAIERLHASGLATPSTMQGCTEEEIKALETACGLTLPAAYCKFLRLAGKQAGKFLVGSDLGYQWLVGNQAQARDLVQGAGGEWPEDGFAFVLHQGYSGLMFRTGDGDDPPVHTILEGAPLHQVADTFSGWLKSDIEDEARLVSGND